jgi:mannose-6-phosphate isomerase
MIIKLKPIALSKVWGGNNLAKIYNIDQEKIGEIWGISGHKSYSNEIVNTEYQGLTLRTLFQKYKTLFGNYPYDEFPILCKIIDASSDLSVQVHPQNSYANKYEQSFGKDECWYILEAKENTRIQIGHRALIKYELKDSIKNQNIEDMLQYHHVKKGDYFYIPSGKVHAICKDTTLLEISQSSDITYRIYDYNRLDQGRFRELHIDKSLDVISFPDTPLLQQHKDEFFNFEIIETNNKTYQANLYGDYIYIIDGNGFIDNQKIQAGDFIIVTSLSKYQFSDYFKIVLISLK